MQSSGAIAAPVRQDYSLFSARPGPSSHRRRGAPGGDDALPAPSTPPPLDFAGDPAALSAVAEALRLAHGHQFNPAFASETARIDPLPHQRIAVYERMLRQDPLRFLLADDAGAGKTIMTGLYVREMLARGRIRRVLVVPPAGLVGNWERELRTLFRLQFRIVSGADARAGNPFRGTGSDLVIVSLDTLAGGQAFGALREAGVPAYDLVVFDEAHKLAAVTENHRVRKTRRYKLAETLAGGGVSVGRGASAGRSASVGWGVSAGQNVSTSRSASPDRGVSADHTAPANRTASTNRTASADRFAGLGWSARHLLLLTATPHMGRDSPWHHLWRLLDPRIFSTGEALRRFPQPERVRHFIRRTKEEMVGLDGRPLYRQRACDTFSYALSPGPEGEQALYDLTTAYLRRVYNRALDNRPAVRLAMSVFQRRLASSTWALLRSFERRIGKLRQTIDDLQSGRMDAAELARRQRGLDREYREDFFDIHGAEDEAPGTPDTPGARDAGAGGGGPAAFARRRRGLDRKHREDFFDAHGAEDGAPDTPGTRDAGARNAGIRNASIRDTVTGGTGSAAGAEPADSIHAGERNESYEDAVLGAVIAVTVEELRHEIKALEDLGARARRLFESGRESKFEKLREVLEDPHHAGEKWLIFSEHRDTVEYLIRRLEGLGFSGRIAQIHGGMAWPEREEQVARFRRPDGARYLVATDAAGEGINLQFCRLMVNYDVPWNPARLEQRMGRIHRYGQQRDVRIVNLIAGGTHEGRVLKVLLEKLEAIRRELRSDKVFDVIGQLFENASLREYMIEALTAEGERRVLERVGSALTGERVRGIGERERRIYGAPPGSGEIAERLDGLRDDMERERYLQLLPGYVRRFVEKAAGLLDLEIRGDLDGLFSLAPRRAGALDPLLPALESYPAAARERLCVRRPETVQGPRPAVSQPYPETVRGPAGQLDPEAAQRPATWLYPDATQRPTTHPYPEAAQGSAARPCSEAGQGPAAQPDTPCIWLHPGEPVFEALSHRTLTAFGRDARRGAIFTDPRADAPYFFHLAVVSVEREPESGPDEPGTPDLFGVEAADRTGMDTANRIGADAESRAGSAKPLRPSGSVGPHHRQTIERRLLGLRHGEDSAPAECPVEHLLLLHGAPDVPPGAVPLAGRGDVMRTEAAGFAERQVLDRLVAEHRDAVRAELPERRRRTVIGFDLHAADLAARRAKLSGRRAGAERAGAKADDALDEIKRDQRLLSAGKERALARLDAAPDRIVPGGVRFLAHALAVPAGDSGEEGERYDARVEEIAVRIALAWERERGGEVRDVSRPELARPAGLPDWPGFDLLSTHPEGEVRHIEVKGRAGRGSIRMETNEWKQACHLGERYWLYVVFDCATPAPRLLRIQDPFDKLLAKSRESSEYTISAKSLVEAAEQA